MTERISRDCGWQPGAATTRGPPRERPKTVIRTDDALPPRRTSSARACARAASSRSPARARSTPPRASTSARATCAAQTRRTLENVSAILEAGGAGVEDVLMFRVYLTTRDDFAAMNEVYGEFLAEHVPSGRAARAHDGVRRPAARGHAGRDRRAGGHGLSGSGFRAWRSLTSVTCAGCHRRIV